MNNHNLITLINTVNYLTTYEKESPTSEQKTKPDDKEALLHFQNSLKSVTHMIHSKHQKSRHIVRDIPNLFACLDENSNIDGCSRIDHFK